MELSMRSARGGGRLARLFGRGGICTACRKSLQRQAYSVAAAPLEQTSSHDVAPVLETSAPRPAWRVRAGLLLARAPQLTRDLTSFEKAYYLYQRRLNERLALPFGRYFYFKKDTPGALEWKRKVKDRRTAARDIGRYDAYSDESWNDEVLVGAKESETQHQAEALLRDSEITSAASSELAERRKDEVEPLQPRLTEADRQQDVGSLNRRLDRTLYLLGREAQGRWGFPAADLIRRESLNQAAERLLVQAAGANMNTWVVGHHPVGHHHRRYARVEETEAPATAAAEDFDGEMTFFMKARIMAGQPTLEGNQLSLTSFRWLCKEEIRETVSPAYWSAIKNMLADR